MIKYLFITGGGKIEDLRNGDSEMPYGSVEEVTEAWAVFRITATQFGIKIDTVSHHKDIVFNPKGSIL